MSNDPREELAEEIRSAISKWPGPGTVLLADFLAGRVLALGYTRSPVGEGVEARTDDEIAADGEVHHARLMDVPSDLLANRFVGTLIMAKGNLNKYDAITKRFIDDMRAEYAALSPRISVAGEGPDLGKIGPGHVCKHGIRWPHACSDCDDQAPAPSVTGGVVEALRCSVCGGSGEEGTPDEAACLHCEGSGLEPAALSSTPAQSVGDVDVGGKTQAKWAAKLKTAEGHLESAGQNGSYQGGVQAQADIDLCKEVLADLAALQHGSGGGR